MDPLTFEAGSLIGIPNLMSDYRAGNVAVLNAFGNSVADDKGIYYFVPKMIRYVLETGTISMEGAAADLAADDRVRKAYLGA